MPAKAAAQCPDGTPPPCAPAQPRVPRIQVLGFAAGGGDTALAYVADALTDDMIASLRSAGGVVVLSARAARGAADYQLSGRVGGSGDGVTVSARLEHPDGRVAWAVTRDRLRRDLAATTGELSSDLLRSIGLRGVPSRSGRVVDPQLYDLVLRGRYQLQRRTAAGVARSTVLFRQAMALDSASALGYAWYAQALVYARRWAYPVPGVPPESTQSAMLAAADRAVELDPSSALVWLMRAQVAQDIIPTSRSSALAALRRSLAIDSLRPDTWRMYSQVLLEVGDDSLALAAVQRAIAIAPDVGEWLYWLSLQYFWRRDFTAAQRWADSALAVDPMLSVARAAAAQVAFWDGRLADAETHAAVLASVGAVPDLTGTAIGVRLLAAKGDSAGGRSALAAIRARSGATPTLHEALAIADGRVALGDTAGALDALEGFPVRGEMHFQMHLRHEPGLDALRALPRFRGLLVAPRN